MVLVSVVLFLIEEVDGGVKFPSRLENILRFRG